MFFCYSSFHLLILWVLFENVMSFHQIKVVATGPLEAGRVNEWVVTKKLGDAPKRKPALKKEDSKNLREAQETKPLIDKPNKCRLRLWHRYYDLANERQGYFVYLFLQGLAFLVTSFGIHVPVS